MKNLLYVFADQWRYHAFGFSKEDSVATPNMDAFASSSLFCSQAVSTYPLCSPHRAALITGKHPLNLGFWTNCKIGLRDHIHLESNEITISDVLHDNGYLNDDQHESLSHDCTRIIKILTSIVKTMRQKLGKDNHEPLIVNH